MKGPADSIMGICQKEALWEGTN